MSAVLDRNIAVGEVVGDDGDVAAHGRGRVGQRGAKLDGEAVGSVGVVGRPVLRPVVQKTCGNAVRKYSKNDNPYFHSPASKRPPPDAQPSHRISGYLVVKVSIT